MQELCQIAAVRVYSLQCTGFPFPRLLLLQTMDSRACTLQYLRLLGSPARAQYLWSTGLVEPEHVGSSRIRDRTCVFLHWQADAQPLDCWRERGSLIPALNHVSHQSSFSWKNKTSNSVLFYWLPYSWEEGPDCGVAFVFCHLSQALTASDEIISQECLQLDSRQSHPFTKQQVPKVLSEAFRILPDFSLVPRSTA